MAGDVEASLANDDVALSDDEPSVALVSSSDSLLLDDPWREADADAAADDDDEPVDDDRAPRRLRPFGFRLRADADLLLLVAPRRLPLRLRLLSRRVRRLRSFLVALSSLSSCGGPSSLLVSPAPPALRLELRSVRLALRERLLLVALLSLRRLLQLLLPLRLRPLALSSAVLVVVVLVVVPLASDDKSELPSSDEIDDVESKLGTPLSLVSASLLSSSSFSFSSPSSSLSR